MTATRRHRNRLVLRALQDAELRELYLQTLERVRRLGARRRRMAEAGATSPEPAAAGWMEREIARIYDQIRDAVAPDTTKITSNEDFEQVGRGHDDCSRASAAPPSASRWRPTGRGSRRGASRTVVEARPSGRATSLG